MSRERDIDAFYFEPLTCSGSKCDRDTELRMNKYSKDVLCESCLQDLQEAQKAEDRVNEENPPRLEYEALTLEERNR